MGKFQLLASRLVEAGLAPEGFAEPEPPSLEVLLGVHGQDYVRDFLAGKLPAGVMRRIGLPWSPELAARTRLAVGGTLLTAELALENGLACNTAGGTHHAFPDYGSGFCIFNDIAVAAMELVKRSWAQRILIVDLDVHQGDGTNQIFRNTRDVFTFSIHGERNFPVRKVPGDFDLALPDGTGDGLYLQSLRETLPHLLDRVNPDFVFYDAGVDVCESDRLGRFTMTREGMYQRDQYVLSEARSRGIPVACVIGGGYHFDLNELVERHAVLFQVVADHFR
ncbi:MAG: histone deacetylase [Puniceicoccaceae bacterium]